METFIYGGNVNCSHCGAVYNSLLHVVCPQCGEQPKSFYPPIDIDMAENGEMLKEIIDRAELTLEDPSAEWLTHKELVANFLGDDKDEQIRQLTEECERLHKVIAEIQEVNDSQQPMTGTTTNNLQSVLEPIRREVIDQALLILRDINPTKIGYGELIVNIQPWPNRREEDVISILWEAKYGKSKSENN